MQCFRLEFNSFVLAKDLTIRIKINIYLVANLYKSEKIKRKMNQKMSF